MNYRDGLIVCFLNRGASSRSTKLIVQERFHERGALLVSKLPPTVCGAMNHLKLNSQIVFLVSAMEFV